MGKVRVTLGKDFVVEYEADTLEDALKFFDHVYSRKGHAGEAFETRAERELIETPLQEPQKLKFPPKEEIKNYILGKPDFEHTSREIQEHFFGFTFTSRGEYKREFLRLAELLRQVRREIAQKHNGTWQEDWHYGDGKNKYKVFRFVQKANKSE